MTVCKQKGLSMHIKFVEQDGGRVAAGFQGTAGDCVTRAIAIATEMPYTLIYDRLAEGNATQRRSKHGKYGGIRSAANGIYTSRKWFKDYMIELGFVWVPTMGFGTVCKVHLRADELPMGKLVVSVSNRMCAVVDRVLYDDHDCSRDGTRCVYGYYKLGE